MRSSEWTRRGYIPLFTAPLYVKEESVPSSELLSYSYTREYRVNDPKAGTTEPGMQKIVGYARASSSDHKEELARQADRISAYIAKMGEDSPKVVKEVGPGTDGSRPRINELLSDSTVRTIVVEHSDRLAQTNVPLIASVLKASGRRLVIIDGEADGDNPA